MDDEERIRKDVLSIVQTYGKVKGIPPLDRDLYTDLGIESVNAISILLALESRFHMHIDDARFIEVRTAGGLVDLVVRKPADKGSCVA